MTFEFFCKSFIKIFKISYNGFEKEFYINLKKFKQIMATTFFVLILIFINLDNNINK